MKLSLSGYFCFAIIMTELLVFRIDKCKQVLFEEAVIEWSRFFEAVIEWLFLFRHY